MVFAGIIKDAKSLFLCHNFLCHKDLARSAAQETLFRIFPQPNNKNRNPHFSPRNHLNRPRLFSRPEPAEGQPQNSKYKIENSQQKIVNPNPPAFRRPEPVEAPPYLLSAIRYLLSTSPT